MTYLNIASLPSGDPAPLFEQYASQTHAQPAFLELSPADGNNVHESTVRFGINGNLGNAVPFDVWNRRTLRWRIPAEAKRETLECLIEDATPLLERICEGHSVVWDGSNYVGRLNEDAAEAEAELETMIEKAFEFGEVAAVWNAGDWLTACGNSSLSNLASEYGITGKTTDAELSAIAETLEQEAKADGVKLRGDLIDVLEEIRTEAADLENSAS